MNYTHLFTTQQEHDAVYNGSDYREPWVAYTTGTETVTYNKGPFRVTLEKLKGFDGWSDDAFTMFYDQNHMTGWVIAMIDGGLERWFTYTNDGTDNVLDSECYIDISGSVPSPDMLFTTPQFLGESGGEGIPTFEDVFNSDIDFITIDGLYDELLAEHDITPTPVKAYINEDNLYFPDLLFRVGDEYYTLTWETSENVSFDSNPLFIEAVMGEEVMRLGARDSEVPNKTMPTEVSEIDVEVVDHLWQYLGPDDFRILAEWEEGNSPIYMVCREPGNNSDGYADSAWSNNADDTFAPYVLRPFSITSSGTTNKVINVTTLEPISCGVELQLYPNDNPQTVTVYVDGSLVGQPTLNDGVYTVYYDGTNWVLELPKTYQIGLYCTYNSSNPKSFVNFYANTRTKPEDDNLFNNYCYTDIPDADAHIDAAVVEYTFRDSNGIVDTWTRNIDFTNNDTQNDRPPVSQTYYPDVQDNVTAKLTSYTVTGGSPVSCDIDLCTNFMQAPLN